MSLQVFVEQLGRREVKFLAVYDMNASSNNSDESRKSRLVMALENITLVTSIKSNRCYESEIVEVRSPCVLVVSESFLSLFSSVT